MGLHYLPFLNSMSLRPDLILVKEKKNFFNAEFVTFLPQLP